MRSSTLDNDMADQKDALGSWVIGQTFDNEDHSIYDDGHDDDDDDEQF